MITEAYRDRAALVTGASSGIGAALARALAEAGARLVLTGRNEERLTEVAQSCQGLADVMTVPADLSDPLQREKLVAATLEHHQRLDVLVNNAGITMNAQFADIDIDLVRRILEIDFFSVVDLTHRLLAPLCEASGRIVVMSSVTGVVGVPSRTAYAAAKHALHGLFDALRVELRPHGVGITIACPGYVDTPIRHRALVADGSEQGRDQAAQRSMLTAEEVAHRTLRAAARRRRRALMGRETVLARWLSVLSPALLERMLARSAK
jgi:short-subunit dehydrogenase